jgi:CHAT domain-containing protein
VLVVCLASSGTLVVVQEPDATPSAQQVRSLIDARRYTDAEAAAERLVAATTKAAGAESLEAAFAADLLVEALLRNGKGAQRSTQDLARRVVHIKETSRSLDAASLAPSLRNLGSALVDAGDYQGARPFFQRALTILERARGPDDVIVAEAIDDLAHTLILSQSYKGVRELLDRALAIKEARLGPDNPGVARTLGWLASLLHGQGSYADARPLLERALRISESVPRGSVDLAETLDLYGDQFWVEGDFLSAKETYVRAVAAAEADGANDPRLPKYLRHLAGTLARLGDLEGAVSTGERALRVAEARLGANHPEVPANLNDLANRKRSVGDYSGARTLYERGLQIEIQRSGPYNDYVATFAHNLALVSADLGDFAEAKRQHDRAIAIWQRVFAPDHPFVATALDALAESLANQGRDVEARTLYSRAFAIREKTLKPGHPDLAKTQMNLARTLFRLGDVRRAMDLSAQALQSLEARETPDLALARASVMRAELEFSLRDFTSARMHYERGLAIRERILGNSSPLVAEARFGLAEVLGQAGEMGSAFEQSLEAEQVSRAHATLTVRYLPERQSLSYAAKRPRALDLALSLADPDHQADRRVLDALVRSRALVLDEMAARRRVSTDAARPEVAPLWAALASSRQRLANLVVRGPSDRQPQQYVALVEEARREKELAERALAEKSATFRDEVARSGIGLDDVRAALPADGILLAYVRYNRTIVGAAATAAAPGTTSTAKPPAARRTVPSYAAFIVRAGQTGVSRVPLGSAAGIDTLVRNWHRELTAGLAAVSTREGERTYRLAGTALRRRVWDPVAPHVKGASTLFVVPDGTLNLVSLVSLPMGQSRYLIDDGPVVHYLSAERDLVTSAAQRSTSRGLLAVGGAAFNDTAPFSGRGSRQAAAGSGPARTRQASCGNLTSMQFEPLLATRDEVREVARLWTESPPQVLAGRDATEGAFKRAAPGQRVLHLATHGFFLGSGCTPGAAGTRAVGGLSTRQSGNVTAGLAENPLLLSGLALAGANQRAAARPGDEDGILTAEEVVALNLNGVEWAVLSACDTGLGEVKIGEGVFGLRRAFQVAGVHTVIMSLWSVEDQATHDWMRALYEGRLRKKLTTASAVHDASLSLVRARRARSLSTHPFFWGAFVAAGDWK